MFILNDKKQCSKCKEWKQSSEFYKHKRKNGYVLEAQCKVCMRKQLNSNRAKNPTSHRKSSQKWYENNKGKVKDYFKSWYAENKERVFEATKRYVEKHPEQKGNSLKHYYRNKEKRLAEAKAWQKSNWQKVLEIGRRWSKNNPEKVLEKSRTRRALKRGSGGTITKAEWHQLLEKAGYKCMRCGSKERLTLDHVVPLAVGGKHEINNAQVLCQSCNSSKGVKIADYRKDR
jgi:5-methylcytosine-specific restriction endonuclease McrA